MELCGMTEVQILLMRSKMHTEQQEVELKINRLSSPAPVINRDAGISELHLSCS